MLEETYPSGRIVRSTMDNDGKLIDLSSKKVDQANFQSYANSFTYTSHGEVSRVRLGNGTWESIEFNLRLQPSRVALGTSAGATDIFSANYEFGEIDGGGNFLANRNNGNIARQTISFSGLSQPFVQTYEYDAVNRLKEAKEMNGATQTWIQTFDYDRYGNRTSFNQQKVGEQPINNTPTVSPSSNRITTGQGFVYDSNGNLIQDDLGRQFTFDGNNKQTVVKDAGNNVIGSYFYDGNGRRVKKVSTFETVVFVYDAGGRLVAEYSNQAVASSGLSYLTSDNLGTTRVITDAAGNVVARRDFMPFGAELAAGTANRTTTNKYGSGADNLRKRFTGYERDSETGLDFAEARYYDDRYGRFTAVDPLLASGQSANPQSFNRYAYVQNNPVVLTDPTGMYSDSEWRSVTSPNFQDPQNDKKMPDQPPKIKSLIKPEGSVDVKITVIGEYIEGADPEQRSASNWIASRLLGFGGTRGLLPNTMITCGGCLGVRTPDAVRFNFSLFYVGITVARDGWGNTYFTPLTLNSGDLKAPKEGVTTATKFKQIINSALGNFRSPVGISAELVFVTANGLNDATKEQTRAALGGGSVSIQGGHILGGSIDLDAKNRKLTAVGMGLTTSRLSFAGGQTTFQYHGGYGWRQFVPWVERKLGTSPFPWRRLRR